MPETAALLLPPPATESHPRPAQSRIGGASSSSFTSMDASIMKLLEQDDDETLHSGADLEALEAALNRDISGEDLTSPPPPPPPHSDHGSKFGKHDTYAISNDKSMQPQKQILPKVELKQNGAVHGPKHGMLISEEANYHKEQTRNNLIHRKGQQNVPRSHVNWVKTSETGSGNDAKYLNLQKMSNRHEDIPRKLTNQIRSTKSVPFALLLPIILPQLDKDKGIQLTTIYEKLKKKDISREHFTKSMRSIVAEKMLLLAVAKVAVQPSTQHKQMPVQTSAPQYHSPNPPASGTTATCKESCPTNLLPQKRSLAEVHSGPASYQQLHSRTTPSPAGADTSTTTPNKPYDDLKKQVETRDSSQPAMSKKPKVLGEFDDQSIEKLVDVTAISGVNLMEEEKRLFSDVREDGRVPEEWRRAVKEEEGKLILQSLPLQTRVAKIMAKCGMKNMNKDVERCLSLSGGKNSWTAVELNPVVKAEQRVDAEKQKHQTVITSDIHQQLIILNHKANQIWTKKQAEAEKLRKLSEPESSAVVNVEEKERDEVAQGKPLEGANNKEGDDRMRTTAANVAARAAVGGDDHWSKWQLMAEQARQRREAVLSETTASVQKQPVSTTLGIITNDASANNNNNQEVANQDHVANRTVSVKDVIGVLEREPQMSKSSLLYHLYNRT